MSQNTIFLVADCAKTKYVINFKKMTYKEVVEQTECNYDSFRHRLHLFRKSGKVFFVVKNRWIIKIKEDQN